jgi:hypothetical protein
LTLGALEHFNLKCPRCEAEIPSRNFKNVKFCKRRPT